METYSFGSESASIVLLQPVDEHDLHSMESELAIIKEGITVDFQMIAFQIKDWNKELSPWKAPAVFGNQDFGDGAADTLRIILRHCADRTKTYYIGGYSLAGLFSLWAAYQTDLFQGVAAASPSVWFPGFTEYMQEQAIQSHQVYLSLGDREEKTRNAVMATVGDRIRMADELLRKQGVNCILEWNQGNHFREADKRTANAFLWLLRQTL